MDRVFELLVANRLPGVTPRAVRELSRRGPLAECLRHGDAHRDLLPVEARRLLRAGTAQREAAAELERLQRLGGRAIGRDDADYPPLLREIHDPPPVLQVLGAWPPPAHTVAVVGARAATPGGRTLASRLAAELGRAGVGVVSGLARGIDAAAHAGALDGGGWTAGVLGTGLDRVYPSEHEALAARIAAGGALVSEFPLGTPPRRGHFPRRNRVIAGMSLAVVVVEASRRSGALVTAGLALDEGRDVLAVPGHPEQPNAAGTNALIRDGARLVRDGADVLDELRLELPPPASEPPPSGLLAHLAAPTTLDQLANRCGRPAPELLRELTALELDVRVRRLPGSLYVRV